MPCSSGAIGSVRSAVLTDVTIRSTTGAGVGGPGYRQRLMPTGTPGSLAWLKGEALGILVHIRRDHTIGDQAAAGWSGARWGRTVGAAFPCRSGTVLLHERFPPPSGGQSRSTYPAGWHACSCTGTLPARADHRGSAPTPTGSAGRRDAVGRCRGRTRSSRRCAMMCGSAERCITSVSPCRSGARTAAAGACPCEVRGRSSHADTEVGRTGGERPSASTPAHARDYHDAPTRCMQQFQGGKFTAHGGRYPDSAASAAVPAASGGPTPSRYGGADRGVRSNSCWGSGPSSPARPRCDRQMAHARAR